MASLEKNSSTLYLVTEKIYEVTKIAIRDTYTALPVFDIRLVDVDKSERRVLATDNTWMDFDTLARIVSELNDELEG